MACKANDFDRPPIQFRPFDMGSLYELRQRNLYSVRFDSESLQINFIDYTVLYGEFTRPLDKDGPSKHYHELRQGWILAGVDAAIAPSDKAELMFSIYRKLEHGKRHYEKILVQMQFQKSLVPIEAPLFRHSCIPINWFLGVPAKTRKEK